MKHDFIPTVTSQEYDCCLIKWIIAGDRIAELKVAGLPSEWSTYPAPVKAKVTGHEFVRDNIFLTLNLPFVVMPGHNHLILIKGIYVL